MNEISEQVLVKDMQHRLIWQAFEDAQTIAEGNGFFLRVVCEDENDLAYTMDFCKNRLNVKLDSGIVTDVVFIG